MCLFLLHSGITLVSGRPFPSLICGSRHGHVVFFHFPPHGSGHCHRHVCPHAPVHPLPLPLPLPLTPLYIASRLPLLQLGVHLCFCVRQITPAMHRPSGGSTTTTKPDDHPNTSVKPKTYKLLPCARYSNM